jgi:phosphoribosylformimino-5-aminoimidazole carboxamide ribotide isomerase
MILYPAIDLKDGACVRLVKGDMASATTFNADPGAQARQFADSGCRWIHVVDLNGAFAGRTVNEAAVTAILKAVAIPVQLGGGIRDLGAIERWLERGVARVILGTAAIKDPGLVRSACACFPGRVAVGIDARAGLAAVEGWSEISTVNAVDLALRCEDDGASAIIYTDIDRDGTMAGPNVAAMAAMAARLTTPVIASGGVSCLDDVKALKAAGGIAGVITGRALYDGRLDLAEALAVLEG